MKNNPEFQKAVSTVLDSKNLQLTKTFTQHGNVSVFAHSMAVAAYSKMLADKLKLKYDSESLVRGAMLHDFFLYDWHETSNIGDGLHGFAHPYTASKNAIREFKLSPRELDIIRKHMWPLTFTKLPKYRESWLVCAVDKYCSVLETFKLNKYNDFSFVNPKLIKKLQQERELNLRLEEGKGKLKEYIHRTNEETAEKQKEARKKISELRKNNNQPKNISRYEQYKARKG